ncbi:MAG TPA: tRNA preQ1(34) S-adenosylmethionine ribosyltransferase-isomerase QueA [Candidatus Hydrogenedentes bacterium]|nr:tRNA preQ1(34) S-adenosylmethionine ribosyltransferase-isomerase QueA [Candidatus Hydrogenedentota bacterium]HRT21560.1 tRNA preQ1(34) S-adenosylmethionine ribosyltransferase-isomerase QueA [Candidatus Hydrogenedentota bacterium]HRT65154.1 tRNA preQ1(34) S-adenosylmethionine ribosyltransferase-isomerase QueA [Candidatus Hydrogenedentota bacterium]
MLTTELDYELPPDRIAQHPAEPRDASRLLVLDRASGGVQLDVFRNIGAYLRRGDCLVMNDTRVIRARLRGRKSSGGQVEIFLLRERSPGVWTALIRPSARVKPGTIVQIAGTLDAVVGDIVQDGQRLVHFDASDVLERLEMIGEIPLPPYILRSHPDSSDLTRYQTVYARSPGAVAAPTAGLHFTPETLAALDRLGIRHATITLHVGYGTFKPIMADTLEEHNVDSEDYVLSEETAAVLNRVRAEGGRIVAVGTTSARVLETCFRGGSFCAESGETGLYIHPPYTFRAVDALQTNFHLPRSSLLALVCAFAGKDRTFEAYRLAIREKFRFYSYGDAMLIL